MSPLSKDETRRDNSLGYDINFTNTKNENISIITQSVKCGFCFHLKLESV